MYRLEREKGGKHGYRGYRYEIDGQQIEDGDYAVIRWPNGDEEIVRLCIEEHHKESGDYARKRSWIDHVLHIPIDYKGAQVELRDFSDVVFEYISSEADCLDKGARR